MKLYYRKYTDRFTLTSLTTTTTTNNSNRNNCNNNKKKQLINLITYLISKYDEKKRNEQKIYRQKKEIMKDLQQKKQRYEFII